MRRPLYLICVVALLALATRCMTLDAAYENVDWRLLILIGGMTAFGTAMAKSGADRMLAEFVVGSLEPFGAIAVLAGFSLLTVILTQPMSNQAAALVVFPIAMQTGLQIGADPRAFGMMVAVAASCSYLTPLEPSCLMVYGPGKYTFLDFLRVGAPLTVLIYVLAIVLVPLVWPM